MIHQEHLRKADELYELQHDNNGNAIHVYIKDGEARVFPCLDTLIRHVYLSEDVTMVVMPEEELDKVYASSKYNFYELLNETRINQR
jgi:hypothetical protein